MDTIHFVFNFDVAFFKGNISGIYSFGQYMQYNTHYMDCVTYKKGNFNSQELLPKAESC